MDGPNDGGAVHPQWTRAEAMARLGELQREAYRKELFDHRMALDEVDRLAVVFAGDPQIQPMVEVTRSILGLSIGPGYADVPAMGQLFGHLGELAEGRADSIMELVPGLLDGLRAHQNGDTSKSLALFTEAWTASGSLPESSPLRQAMTEMGPMVELMRSLEGRGPGDDAARDRLLKEVRSQAATPGVTDAQRALCLVASGGAALNQGKEQDPARINRGIADLREAVSLTPSDDPEYVLRVSSLALGVYHRSDVTGSLADVDEAIALLERARERAGGPAHPHWSFVTDMLLQFRTRRGESMSSNPTTLDALRGHTWQVLLQSSPGAARTQASGAAQDAVETAGRCLLADDPSGALRVLDAGRGLMLFAATELRDPSTRLIDANEPELAARWRAEERPSPRLREQVVEVLARDTDLLDPPTLEEIQEALGRLGADALVYLVPAASPMPGWAVIAPAEGAPRYLSLPNLAVGNEMEIERYLAAAAARDTALGPESRDVGSMADFVQSGEVGSVELADFVQSLDGLCGWAWKAAMGPILKPYLDGRPDRTPRLVIIPVGDLARVPWQAARRPDGKYLVELATVSQAASARMLCASAAAAPVRHTTTGLMVADPVTGKPTSDLLSARLEAYAIHRSFYPGATYVGRRPNGTVSGSGAGTPEDVRNWLGADGSQAGSMVHFATHGGMVTDPNSASSHLLLAGGNLTAEELIRTLDAERHPIGLVVLAGCHTGRSIHGYDEAYSLGTLFLAAGARTVLSTQWSIPDEDTSLLMYMFHHFLITKSRSPLDALREAQLWMLDDAREPPGDMPAPLRRMLADTDPTRITSWAGFVHWGQ